MNKEYMVISNTCIAYKTYEMKLKGDTSQIKSPGQFLNIKIDDSYTTFLRRPISIASYKENEITIIYKVFGEGTKKLSEKRLFDTLDILCPLGNGFDISIDQKKALLVGGGIGVPPLIGVAKELHKKGILFDVVLGFNNEHDVFSTGIFSSLADKVYVTTMDGTFGYKGNVLDIIKSKNIQFDYYYACGPEKMLHALVLEGYKGQLSFEKRMGCGFGACMGCSTRTLSASKRICKEGPVLESSEVYVNA